MSDHTRRFYARQMFALRVHSAKGFAYEDLFKSVMQRRYAEFTPLRPYGNIGDRKNDGYIPSSGTFFQLYAPVDPSEKLAKAARKANDDFDGLKASWESDYPIKTFKFVFNDEFRGSVEPIEKALADIAQRHGINARPFLAKDLESEFMQLPLDEMQLVIQTIIPEAGVISDADYSAVREVVEFVLNMSELAPIQGKLVAPDLDEKIKFNGLNKHVSDLLSAAAYQVDVVDDYFSQRGGGLKQDLRDHLAAVYGSKRDEIVNVGGRPDEVFFGVLEALTPPADRMVAAVQTAVLVIMAYYFEACDIFEAPDVAS